MQNDHDANFDYDLLCQQAYQSWLDRGQAMDAGDKSSDKSGNGNQQATQRLHKQTIEQRDDQQVTESSNDA